LGDTVLQNSTFYLAIWFPFSISAEYADAYTKWRDIDTLYRIVKHRMTHELNPSLMVVHLRLGDVVNTNISGYAHDITFYQNLSVPDAITRAIVVSSDIHTDATLFGLDGLRYYMLRTLNLPTAQHTRSERVREKVVAALRDRGLMVSSRTNMAADDDFVFMSSAAYFVCGGGGFSLLVSEMVRFHNGTVIGDCEGRERSHFWRHGHPKDREAEGP
jgi:hypothetical protein